MNVSLKSLLACAFILTIAHTARAEYDVDAYCTLVANGIKLASVDDCQTFYTCMNGRATAGMCAASQAYDKNTQTCRPKSDVKCFFGVDQPCIGQSDTFVPVANSCNGYIYCKNNAEAGRGQCPYGQIFYNGACVYGNCNDNINGGQTNQGLQSVCQIMPNNKFFGSTKNCQIWQLCSPTEGLKQGSCDSAFVFDVQNGNCNYKTANMCSRVTGQDIQPDPTPATRCAADDKHKTKPDPSKCSSYFVCDGDYWIPTPCASGQFFSVPEDKCLSRQEATPATECNRCEFTKRQFVNAVDPSCRKYWVCAGGYIKNYGFCDPGSYLNEVAQSCIVDSKGLKDYADANGACRNVEVPSPTDCKDTCKVLAGAACKAVDDCQCGLEEGTCVECGNGYDGETNNCKPSECPDTCEALAVADCVRTDGCKCGLNPTECGECEETIDSSKKCATCDAYCTGLTAAKCKPNEDCECGKDDAGKCSNCAGGVEDDGTCKVDCVAECALLEGTECKDFGPCTCGFNDGKCAECDENFCNECVCEGADCPAGEEQCLCYDDGTSCTYCPAGLTADEDGCEEL